MANYCSNSVKFMGKEEDIEKTIAYIKNKMENNKVDESFELVENQEKYWFHIYFVGKDAVEFETKWAPSIEDLDRFTNSFNVGFEYIYSEPSCEIYGVAIKNDKGLKDYDLGWEDFNEIHYNEDKELYTSKHGESESQEELLQYILQEKYGIKLG